MKKSLYFLLALALVVSGLVWAGQVIVTEPPVGRTEKDPVFTQWVKVKDTDTEISKMPTTGWQDFVHPGSWISSANAHSAYYKGGFDWDGQGVVKLTLGAVNHKAKLWVNGRPAGTHLGGYLPFSFDITTLSMSGHNVVVLGATDFSASFEKGFAVSMDRDYPKNSIVLPIGSTVPLSGLIVPAKLEKLPSAYIEGLWVKTSVNEKRISLQVDLVDPHAERMNNCQVTAWVEELDGTQVFALGDKMTDVTADGNEVDMEGFWDRPKLWSPENPNLYRCVTVLSKDGKEIHRKSQVFGYREFESKLGDFYLNGKKIVLRSTSKHYGNGTRQPLPADYAKTLVTEVKALNANCLRFHANPYPEAFLEEADRQGLLIIDESAAWCFGMAYNNESEAFWNNLRRMWDEHISRDFNHPSWVIASIENEMLLTGGSSKKSLPSQLSKLGKYVKEKSGRLIMFEGDDDPAGAADIPNLHYPWEPISHVTYPQDAYFLADKFVTDLYPGTEWSWNHAKPLMIGEFLWLPDFNSGAVTEGDKAYEDIEVARYMQKARLFNMYVQAFREQGVDGFCPWNPLEDYKSIVPEQIVPLSVQDAYTPARFFVRERDTDFFEGAEASRTVTVQNYSENLKNLTLVSKFGDREEKWTLPFQPCETGKRPIILYMPTTSTKKTVVWKLTLLEGSDVKYTQTITYTVHPKTFTSPKFTLLANSTVAGSFKSAGLDFTLATKVADVKTNPVVVAPDTLSAGDFDKLVAKGIRPIVLYPQKAGTMPDLGYQTVTSSRQNRKNQLNFTTMTWTRKTANIDRDTIMRYFAGDNIVAVGGFQFAPGLVTIPIAESSTSGGPYMTALEYVGKCLATSIPIAQKISSEPRCREILRELVSLATRPLSGKGVFTTSTASSATIANLGFASGKVAGVNYVTGSDITKSDMSVVKKSFTSKDSVTVIDRPITSDKKTLDFIKSFDPSITLSYATVKPQKGLTLNPTAEFAGMSRGDIFMATAYSNNTKTGIVVPLALGEITVSKANWYQYIANKSIVMFKNKAGARLIVNFTDWDRSTNAPLVTILANVGATVAPTTVKTLGSWQLDKNVIEQNGKILFNGNGKATANVSVEKESSASLVFSSWQQKAGKEAAKARISIDGKVVATQTVENTTPKTFSISVKLTKGSHKVTFEFVNDYYNSPEDRNLYLGWAFIRF